MSQKLKFLTNDGIFFRPEMKGLRSCVCESACVCKGVCVCACEKGGKGVDVSHGR